MLLFALLPACATALVLVPPNGAIKCFDDEAPKSSITTFRFDLRAAHIQTNKEVTNNTTTTTTTTTAAAANQPNVVHTENTATGGLDVPPNKRRRATQAIPTTANDGAPIIIDAPPLLPQLRSTPVILDGTTIQPFPFANPDSSTQHRIHEQTLPPSLPLLILPAVLPEDFASSTTSTSYLPSSVLTAAVTDPPSVIIADSSVFSPYETAMSGEGTMDVERSRGHSSGTTMSSSTTGSRLTSSSMAGANTTHGFAGSAAVAMGSVGRSVLVGMVITISAALLILL